MAKKIRLTIAIYLALSVMWSLIMAADKAVAVTNHHLRLTDGLSYFGVDLALCAIYLALLAMFVRDNRKIFICGMIALMAHNLFNLCHPLYFIYTVKPALLKDPNEALAWVSMKRILQLAAALNLAMKALILITMKEADHHEKRRKSLRQGFYLPRR